MRQSFLGRKVVACMDKWGNQEGAALSRADWDDLLVAKDADRHLEALSLDGRLERVFPEIHRLVGFGGQDSGHKDLWEHTKRVVIQTVPTPLLRWTALFHDCGKPLAFSRANGTISFHNHEIISARVFRMAARRSGLFQPEEVTRIIKIIKLLGKVEQYQACWRDSAVRRLGIELGPLVDDVLSVARADCTTANSMRRRHAQARCHELKIRLLKVKESDATPPALPHGLGTAIMTRLGYQERAMSREQKLEMKRLMGELKAAVESGVLPRSGAISCYMEKLETLL